MPLICTPLQASTQAQVLQKWRALNGKTDLVELWLDSIRDLDLLALLKQKPTPVICKGARALEAAKYGADYIDLPFKGKVAPRTRAKLILSHHDFKRTPSYNALLKLALRMHRAGADIVKIATMARSLSDTMQIIFLAQELKQRGILHVLIAMGSHGQLSRILTPHLGGTIMFSPLKRSETTAPGQLIAAELRRAWALIK